MASSSFWGKSPKSKSRSIVVWEWGRFCVNTQASANTPHRNGALLLWVSWKRGLLLLVSNIHFFFVAVHFIHYKLHTCVTNVLYKLTLSPTEISFFTFSCHQWCFWLEKCVRLLPSSLVVVECWAVLKNPSDVILGLGWLNVGLVVISLKKQSSGSDEFITVILLLLINKHGSQMTPPPRHAK